MSRSDPELFQPETPLTLISHVLCPYVQRAVISLKEKGVAFERIDIDLADRPGWFADISPLGKTPVLRVGDTAIFESAVILEYLEETLPNPLHPGEPLKRAEHRSWIEFGSAVLADIAGFYSAGSGKVMDKKVAALRAKFEILENKLGSGPYFSGSDFGLVDTVFGPIFRYFDVFDQIAEFGILTGKPKVAAWRKTLASRPSVRDAVVHDYPARLWRFISEKDGYLGELAAKAQLRTKPAA